MRCTLLLPLLDDVVLEVLKTVNVGRDGVAALRCWKAGAVVWRLRSLAHEVGEDVACAWR